MYGRCWAWTRCEGVRFGGGVGDEVLPSGCFGAIAEVERRFRGRDAAGLLILRLGEEADGLGARCVGEGRAISNFEGPFPLLCAEGGLDDFGGVVEESLWDRD